MKLRFFGFLLLLLSGVFVVQAFQAGNPQVPQGGGNSFTVTGTEAPANSEQWDIINSASTVVATASLPSGWTVSLTGTQFSVAAPTNASVATNYRVRYGSGGVTPGPLSVRKAFFRSQLQSNSYNEWGQYVPPQSIASRRRLAGGGANPPIGGGGGGTTGQSAIFDVVSGGTPPAAPSSLIATPISSSRIDLAWTDNAHNESGFTIQRQLTVGGTWADIGTVGANVNSYSSFGLSPDTSYRFRVKATNSWGASAWSNEAIASTFPSAPLPPSYLGNDFWAVLPAGGPDQGQSVWLHIAAPDGATGMIAIPSSNTQIPFTVSAGDAVRIQLPMGQPYPQGAGLRLYTSEGIESKSIRITSDNAITVQVQSSIYAASESFALQPTSVLGKSYVVASYPSSGGIMAGMFAIQATQAATTVTVRTTKTVGTLFQTGIPYTFVLQAGEAFQLRDTSGQDLTGSLITADKPVAVYSGSNGANVPGGVVAANPLTEQLVPVERWGYTYYSAGFATKTADSVYRVLAYKNNTPIAIDGVLVATIHKGEFYEFSSPNGIQISSTKPIQPFEYCTGGSADFVTNSDPSMTAIPAVTSYASTYLFYAANDPSFYTGLFVNLYVPTSALSSMRLNGVSIPLSNFTSIGSSNYSVAKVAVPAGKNLITSTTGAKFGAINYGFGSYDSFSSPLGGDLPENFVTNVTPLPASSLVATTISSSQIDLAWTDNSSNEDGFRIERKLTAPGSEWSEIASVSANTTTYQNTGLTKLTTYIYRVKAYADFDSTPSNEAQATTLDAPPSIPTNLSAQVLSQTEIKLTWNDVSDNEQGFKVQRKQGTGAWADVQTLGAGITTWTDTGLTKKTTYSYRVYAYNAVGNSDFSNVATATTKDSIPNPPTNLAATAPSWNLVTLSWTDASDNEDGFKLERKQGAGAWVQIASPVPNTTSYIDSTVQASTTYSYRVRAYNSGGDSEWSNESTVTTPEAPIPSAPTNLSAIATSASTISLSWTDTSTTETGFTVQRAPLGSSSWSTVGTANQNVTVWSDTGLSANTGYSYRVCAFNATGSSGWSNVASAQTGMDTNGTGSFDITVAGTGPNRIAIYWGTQPGCVSYNIYRSQTGTNFVKINSAPVSPGDPGPGMVGKFRYSDTSVPSGVQIYYRIVGVSSAGNEIALSSMDSDEASYFSVPWDSDNTQAVVLKVDQRGSMEVPSWGSSFSRITCAFGPNGVGYERTASGSYIMFAPPEDSYVGEYIVDSQRNKHPKAKDKSATTIGGTFYDYGPTTPPTGIYRKVEGLNGSKLLEADVIPGLVSGMDWTSASAETAYAYSGGEIGPYAVDCGLMRGLDYMPNGWSIFLAYRGADVEKYTSLPLDAQNDVGAPGPVHLSFKFSTVTDKSAVATIRAIGGQLIAKRPAEGGQNVDQVELFVSLNKLRKNSQTRVKRVNSIAQKLKNSTGATVTANGIQNGFFYKQASVTGASWTNVKVDGSDMDTNNIFRQGGFPNHTRHIKFVADNEWFNERDIWLSTAQ